MQSLDFMIWCARPQADARIAELIDRLLENPLIVWVICGTLTTSHDPLVCLTEKYSHKNRLIRLFNNWRLMIWRELFLAYLLLLTRRIQGSWELLNMAKYCPLSWWRASWFCSFARQIVRLALPLWAGDRIARWAWLLAFLQWTINVTFPNSYKLGGPKES